MLPEFLLKETAIIFHCLLLSVRNMITFALRYPDGNTCATRVE